MTKPGDTPVSLIDPSSDQIQNDMILELIGEVNGDGSITAMLVIQFSSNFGMLQHHYMLPPPLSDVYVLLSAVLSLLITFSPLLSLSLQTWPCTARLPRLPTHQNSAWS